MPSRAATFANVTVYNPRASAGRDYRRTVLSGAVVGLGSVSAVAVMAGTVAVAAAWMVSGSLRGNPEFRARAPFALESVGLPAPPRRLADPLDMFGGALASANPAYAPIPMREAELAPAATANQIPSQARPRPVAALADSVPLPAPRPSVRAPMRMRRDVARVPAFDVAPPVTVEARQSRIDGRSFAERARTAVPRREELQRPEQIASVAPLPPAPPTTGSVDHLARPGDSPHADGRIDIIARPAAPRLAYNNPETVPARDSHTAIYDIVAHTVYLPDGERLEAHSGLGPMLDNPRYVTQKGRGPTPPNIYDLTLRRGIFHGVQALRLNPVADSRMYGRDGILAHTYMLGPSGQSFGCVSFKHYAEFLRAFENGEVNRLVVVPHLTAPPPVLRAERASGKRYAFDMENEH